MKTNWTRAACALLVMILLCGLALPAAAETDVTLNTFAKYAKVLQGKGASFKDGVPDVKRFHWEEYDPETKPMVVFNDETVTVHAGDALFEEMAAYKPARWKYRQR